MHYYLSVKSIYYSSVTCVSEEYKKYIHDQIVKLHVHKMYSIVVLTLTRHPLFMVKFINDPLQHACNAIMRKNVI